jgi:hypothetical protein
VMPRRDATNAVPIATNANARPENRAAAVKVRSNRSGPQVARTVRAAMAARTTNAARFARRSSGAKATARHEATATRHAKLDRPRPVSARHANRPDPQRIQRRPTRLPSSKRHPARSEGPHPQTESTNIGKAEAAGAVDDGVAAANAPIGRAVRLPMERRALSPARHRPSRNASTHRLKRQRLRMTSNTRRPFLRMPRR